MTNYAEGHYAETVAAAFLKRQKYKVIALNWKTPACEVDIIARRKRGPVTFFEVKYRKTTTQGTGLDYITPRKLEQMAFAAQIWVAENHYSGEYTLGAIELGGQDFAVTGFLESVI